MKNIKLEKGEIIISKWKRENEEEIRGIKVSMVDNGNIATTFLSLKECEELIVALFREKEEVKKDLKNGEVE